LYLIVSIWNLIKNKDKAGGGEIYLTLVNTAILLMFTIKIVPAVYQSLVIAGWMLVYAISGFFVFNQTKNENLFFVHSMISILLLAIATSIELSGQTLVIAFAIEAAIISVSAFIVTSKISVSERLGLLMIPSILMSFQSISSREWANGIFHSDFVVLLVLAVVLGVLGIFYKSNTNSEEGSVAVYFTTISASTFYIFALVWLVSHSVITNDDSAVFFSLFVYTVVGLWTHFAGIFKGNSGLKKYGMTLLILVVARLVLVDVWNMELVLRVITFIVLGIMFMSTAFISKNQKQQIA
jgi:hypothetical protein